jgi:hypothetical protein
MAERRAKALSWGSIIGIMMITGLAVGVLLGVLGELLDLGAGKLTGGVGAAMGVVGALLIGQRRAALAALKKPEG